MSGMGYLERLLDGAGVEWLPLGNPKIGRFVRGGGLQKKDFVEHGVPCIHYGQIYTYYGTSTNRTKSFVTEDFAKSARKAQSGDLIIATTSENDDDVCKAVAWLGDCDVVVSNDACFYKHSLNPKYVSYFFQTENFQNQKRVYITGTKVRRVNADDLAKILIPIPCPDEPKKSLEIQAEIVRILDTFSEVVAGLNAELSAELDARKNQYEHYRKQIFNFKGGDNDRLLDGEGVSWVVLEDVVKVMRGKRLTKNQLSEDDKYQVFHGGLQPLGCYCESNRPANSVMIINVGAAGTVGFSNSEFWSSDGCFTLSHSERVNSKFLYHFMVGQEYYMKGKIRVAAIPTLDAFTVEKIMIPIPCPENQEKSMAIQAEIVRIMDSFNKVHAELEAELNAELDGRKKQYEYYRDKLLSFSR